METKKMYEQPKLEVVKFHTQGPLLNVVSEVGSDSPRYVPEED